MSPGKEAAVEIEVVGLYTPGPKADGGGGSGYIVREHGHSVLVDCGPGVVATLQQRGLTETLDAVYITHWHADHSSDLLPLAYVLIPLWLSQPERRRPALHLPEGGAAFLDMLRSLWAVPTSPAFNNPFNTVFDIREYTAGERFDSAGFSFEPLTMRHAAPYCGVRISGSEGRVAFSGDMGWCENLPKLADDVGVFVCEATLQQPDTSGHGHLCAAEAGAAAAVAHPHELLLTHFSSSDPEFIEQQRAAAPLNAEPHARGADADRGISDRPGRFTVRKAWRKAWPTSASSV
jgi:ribonuclease BN (tRNA processing enzyme)